MGFRAYTKAGIEKEKKNAKKQKMKVITINVPRIYLAFMFEMLKEDEPNYPSRSELVRAAIKDFIVKELLFRESLKGYLKRNNRRLKEEKERKRLITILEAPRYKTVKVPIENYNKGLNEV
jgi:metal-responsive CopG/Arc/MetJ family transcriptional regulator